MLDEVDSTELVVVDMLGLEVDNVLLLVELRRTTVLPPAVAESALTLKIDAEENGEEAMIVDLADLPVACVWALAMDTEVSDERATTRNMMVIRLRTRVLLPKPATFIPNLQGIPSIFELYIDYGL